MEIVYYRDQNLNYCPVKKYFSQFKNNIDLLARICRNIDMIAENNGIPQGFFSKKLSGLDGFEVKVRKSKGTVIRIIYFLHQNKMILLNAFEKPDNYDTRKEKRKIDKQIEIAKQYIKNYKLNPKLYEKY
ncbi:MAG: type II toxin-antitoxin system RelE/ParE family toxin [Candidatus Staskawiczbacteria bacterium]|nr:type II toxin-antitoxin system RelE/ParE family toxin [Candidatus Staskawiczbacteria bacterium]